MPKKPKSTTTRPSGRTTAYAYFQKNYLKKDRTYDKTRLVYNCVCVWKNMSDAEKRPWLKMEEDDKERYEREMKEWKERNPLQGNSKRHFRSVPKRVTKPRSAPKHPLSAYFWWGYSVRPDVTKANPGKGVCAISKILGEMWKDVQPDVRLKYELIAEKDKVRYKREKQEYLRAIREGRVFTIDQSTSYCQSTQYCQTTQYCQSTQVITQYQPTNYATNGYNLEIQQF